MIEFSKKLAYVFLRTGNNSVEPTPLKERYKQFRGSLLIAITIIALVPSTLLAVLGYFRYLDLSQRQSANQIRWHLQFVSHYLDKHIQSLKHITATTASQLLPVHFESRDHLQILLKSMQESEASLMHIEILNSRGNHLISTSDQYTPVADVKHTSWFQDALAGEFGMSDFYPDHEPHFILATRVKADFPPDGLLCKVIFSISSLESNIKKLNAEAMDDVFLINRDLILQSSSNYFGSIGSQTTLNIPASEPGLTSTQKKWGMGKIFYASTPIADSPWVLVLIKDGPIKKKEWLTFQLSLVLIFLACAAGSFVIIHQLVNILTIRIRESDNKRMALLNEVGHTNRLATIGKLAAGVAHEINNPLAVIDQKAGLVSDILAITEDFSNKEKLQNSLKGIHSNVDRCKVITHRLLGFARKMDSINEQLDINDIIMEVVGFLEKEALFSHIFFDMQLKQNLPSIWSDRGQLQQIFLNIISNSIDAIHQNGNIKITTSLTRKKLIKVSIEDDGPGIKPDVMEHIFDPFFTTKETGEGTGLGLSITYGLVKKLGGNIKVRSEVEEGTVFYIYLPTQNSIDRDLPHG